MNNFLQIHVDGLGSVFADVYTSLYIAFDDVLSERNLWVLPVQPTIILNNVIAVFILM